MTLYQINCSVPAFDEDGVTDIGTCGRSEYGTTAEGVERTARASGWVLPDRLTWHRIPLPVGGRRDHYVCDQATRCPYHPGPLRIRVDPEPIVPLHP